MDDIVERKIYVASSWRCVEHPRIVSVLRNAGHDVYDFRNPKSGNRGFAWSEIDPDWLDWTPASFVKQLEDPIAQAGFALDKEALDWCDTCVLVLPCGRSAHLEAGYAIGQGKQTIFYLSPDRFEPELMYLLGDKCVTTDDELLAALAIARLRAADGWQAAGPPWEFDRYINGTLMAEGVRVSRETTFADAARVAAKLAAKGPNREVPVLVCCAAPPAATAPQSDTDVLAEIENLVEATLTRGDLQYGLGQIADVARRARMGEDER